MQFKRLRLVGFKSFVDPTNLSIEPGLTGVVGPNGCGKSNLVEALKWVMGETSAKQMRGGEMEDVIFAGASNRPPRNVAEVSLLLDNSARKAPAALNDADELEIVRRIERDRGSRYLVNGKEVRARDVQLLFADAASGARSTALVSQGQIGTIINAKPSQRRTLLEEAAGISGLHSRRHEAELRLRGAESNMERLDDVIVTLEAQAQNLKKQAKQATRYRNLSDHIRKAEATMFHLRWGKALDDLDIARERLRNIQSGVNELTGLTAQASSMQAEASTGLPELRQAEAEAAATLQRLVLAREQLDQEERRIAGAKREAEQRLTQIERDLEREKGLVADAEAGVRQLESERQTVEAARQGEGEAREKAAKALEEAARAAHELEARLAALTEKVATDEARRNDLNRRIGEAKVRAERLAQRAGEAAGQKATLEASAVNAALLAEAESTQESAREKQEGARLDQETAEAGRIAAAEAAEAARADAQEKANAVTRLEAEKDALSRLLAAGITGEWTPVLDQLEVAPGFEAALGAALGEDLEAPLDEVAAHRHWRSLPPTDDLAPLPSGVSPLSDFVRGPQTLYRRLSQIGVVAAGEAQALVGALKPGQRLVDRDGGLWRWDGLCLAAGAPTPAAIRLEQRNRLAELQDALEDARKTSRDAAEAAQTARDAAEAANQAERAAREATRAADAAYVAARDKLAVLRQKAAENDSRLAALAETIERLGIDKAEAEAQAAEAERELAALPDPSLGREEVAGLRADLAERRSLQVEAKSAHDGLVREAEARGQRLAAIGREIQSWHQRRESAHKQMSELTERRADTAANIERLSAKPQQIEAQRGELVGRIEQAEINRKAAADRLAESETKLSEADRGLKQAEAELARAREEMVRAEGAVEQGRQTCQSLAERIHERLECTPDGLKALIDTENEDDLPELGAIEAKLERLQRERETMGPVNLRAEQEQAELTEQLETLLGERGDLTKAIEKLRHGIAELNREGRERLLASFKEVDRHFQDLFVRLFGGGRAHLELLQADDPLEAGLEIMASPPGKRLQVLSLLSGGEQALTALALLFGVFMTNPAPICVLDEVDAPLDDANVDRFCSLVEEMAKSGLTRFLVITHHRMSMARMDRLFGVTMQERGVSQLVSVDLQKAEALRATA